MQIYGEVNEDMLAGVEQALAKSDQGLPLKISLVTDGGDLNAALGIYALLTRCTQSVEIDAPAQCYSAGTIILLAGDVRISAKYSTFLIHFGFESASSKKEQKLNAETERWMRKVYMEGMGVSNQQVGRWLNQETYWTASEAVKRGLIHEIK